ncbi:MAG: YfcE family phosphodiesterase [Oscillospiraceae bacterium]|jgi:putative phosphoesterase|nr:YfcE family phosphodiesterase [Oscillospiraceae bacterium]
MNNKTSKKILVFSDTHRDTERMEAAILQHNPSTVIHLGDNADDAMRLQNTMPQLPFIIAKGNCDIHTNYDIEKLVSIGDIKIFITHGHIYRVKDELSSITWRASELCADLVLYGHTHIANIVVNNGITLMNPGQMQAHSERLRASFGIVTIIDCEFDCEIVWF